MKKLFRIRKNEEFSKIIKDGHSVASSNFVVHFFIKKEANCRVGISVSKKHGNAVVRNRIKRQVREMARELIDFDDNRYDYIIVVRLGFDKCSYQENLLDLEKALKKAIIE